MTQGARNTHTTAPRRLRAVHQGLVHSPCVSVPILKPWTRCLHPLRPSGRKANAPWIPSWRKSNGKYDIPSSLSRILTSNREQAEREAKYSRHGTSTWHIILNVCLTAITAHVGRSVTALAGMGPSTWHHLRSDRISQPTKAKVVARTAGIRRSFSGTLFQYAPC